MWIIALQRFLILCLTMVIVSILAFLVPYMSEGDPIRTIIMSRVDDPAIDPATIEAMRVQLGLDRPLHEQYLGWLWNALRGDFGFSFTNHAPVGAEVARAVVVSFTLTISALGIALIIALPLGTLSAMRPGKAIDNVAIFLTQILVAVPEYWFAPMAVLVFSLYLGLLPSAGWDGPASMILPALALSLRPLAYFTAVSRAAMIDVLQAPYITAARSRGLSMNQTVIRHGLRNGAMPVVTLFALWFASLIGGSVVVEVIFAIPGMGRLVYEAVVNNDVPVLQGSFVCIVALSVLINTLADALYILLNPVVRIRNVH